MWALVKNNSVVEIIIQPKGMTIDTIQYPKNIFKLWSASELKSIGIYKVIQSGSAKTTDLYVNSYKDEFKDDVVTRTHINTEKNVDEVKKELLRKINFSLFSQLEKTVRIVTGKQHHL